MALDEVQPEGAVYISAEVPATHTVTIRADGGQIIAEEHVYGKSVQIERQKAQVWKIAPDEGKQLVRLLYDGEDVTDQVKDGVFTAPAMIRDLTLEAVFQDAPTTPGELPPQTGDNGMPILPLMILLAVSGGALALIGKKRKSRA